MRRLDEYVARRNELAQRYDRLLADLPVQRPGRDNQAYSAFHLSVVRVDPDRRRTVFEHLRANGIGVNVHYIPVHTQPYWQRFGFRPGQFPAAEDYYARTISLPLYPTMSVEDQDTVVRVLAEALA